MKDLDSLRQGIDAIDAQILRLLAERLALVLEVGAWKREHGRPVYDPERERWILAQLAARAPAGLSESTVRRVFERIIDESRRAEHAADGR